MYDHPSQDVRYAIIRLNDALCTWERSTGRQSALIVRENDWCHRSMSGKPGVPDDVTDEQLLSAVKEPEQRPVDVIRKMNPGKFIPSGAEMARLLKENGN